MTIILRKTSLTAYKECSIKIYSFHRDKILDKETKFSYRFINSIKSQKSFFTIRFIGILTQFHCIYIWFHKDVHIPVVPKMIHTRIFCILSSKNMFR